MRRRLNSEDGFGLIELTIALTVLAIGITSVTSLFVTGHFALRRASQSDTAAVMAQQLLERFRAETWHKIGLSSALVSSTDSVYQSDSAYNATTAVTFDSSNDPNLVLDSAYPQEVLDTTH